MSDPFSTTAFPPSLDLDRLRAALRLVLEPGRADHAAERIDQAQDSIAAIADLAGDLNRDRLLSRINRRFDHSVVPEETSPRSAVMLLAHVTLGVDGERIEDGFGIDERELGEELLNARAQYGGQPTLACREMAWLLGRYRDPALPTDDRVRLLSHLQACEGCRDALEASQVADTKLIEAVDREQATLAELVASPRPRGTSNRFGSVAIVGGVIGLLIAVLAAGSFVGGLFSADDEPVPLFAGEYRAGERFDGWLIQVSPVGFLEAVDLATGFKRGLDSGDASGGFVPVYHISDSHIATWRPSDGQREDALTIGPIGEQIQHRLTWNRQFEFWYVSGWLDDDTLLIVKSPKHIPGETEQQYLERQKRESRLIAFDAETGAESTLMTGNVAAAYPSPDGTMLAVYQPYDWRWPGYTIEIRPTDGSAIGDPIVQIERRATVNGVWMADSSAYVVPIIADAAVRMETNRQLRTLREHGVERIELQRIGIDGSQSVLVTATVPDSIVPVSSSPDGRTIVYEVRTGHGGDRPPLVPAYDWSSYRLVVDGGEPELLAAGATPERVYRPVWSPDGRALALPVARAFPLATDGRLDQSVGSNGTTLLIFGEDWQPGDDPVAFYSAGRDLHGWLPPDAFDSRPGETAAGGRSLAAIAPDGGAFEQLAIDGAASDQRGTYVLVEDRQTRAPFAWSVDAQRPRRLSDSTATHSWFNNGTATIAVASEQDGQPGSRIVLSVAEITRSPAYLDHRYFDPAGLADDRDRRYVLPLVAPGGVTVSFFVIDDRRGEIALWVDDAERPATVVGRWSFPAEVGVEPAIVAAWIAADTLLFAIPDDWRDSQPEASSLSRLVIAANGNHRIDPLITLEVARGATGVELVEFAVSPDGSELAYRLRHTDPGGAIEDTLHVASTSDLNRAIELDRGGRGDGLQWTADGEQIVGGVRGRVARYAADGRSREYLSPRGVSASNAILVDGQLWFNGVDDRGARIWTIELE